MAEEQHDGGVFIGSVNLAPRAPNYNYTAFCNLFLAAQRGKRSKACMVLESLSLALKLEPAEH